MAKSTEKSSEIKIHWQEKRFIIDFGLQNEVKIKKNWFFKIINKFNLHLLKIKKYYSQ